MWRVSARSSLEEAHLDARELDHVVVDELAGLAADRSAVHEREILRLVRVDVHDEVTVGAAGDRGHLDARTAECRERLVELELATCERTGEHLQLRFLDGNLAVE